MPGNGKLYLRDILPVMGDMSPNRMVYVAFADKPDDRVITDARTAASAHEDAAVLKCVPRGNPDGMPDGNLYVLEQVPGMTDGYVANPAPIPVNVPCWRVSDEAWFVPGSTMEPVRGTISGIAYPARRRDKALMTVNATGPSSMTTYPGIPADALFASRKDALAAIGRVD